MKCKILVEETHIDLQNAINDFIKDKENVEISFAQRDFTWSACILYDRCYADSMI